MRPIQEGPAGSRQFQTVIANAPPDSTAEFWRSVRARMPPPGQPLLLPPDASSLEMGLTPIATLSEAPPRTAQSTPVMRSSPMPFSLRAMLEQREFGRSC
jgi:hypothetical protein